MFKQNDLSSALTYLLLQYNIPGNDYPFLKHLDYFKNSNEEITVDSIACKWAKLTGEFYYLAKLKAWITVSGANHMDQNYKNGVCPWQDSFGSKQMMKNLKHPCDSEIVKSDGSIDVEVLRAFVLKYFVIGGDTYVLTQSAMNQYVEVCIERDADKELNIAWNLPGAPTIAKNEWIGFFHVFKDGTFSNGDPYVTLETFIQFYFGSDALVDRVLRQL